MALIRHLYWIAAKHSFNLKIRHIAGTSNSIADALSRLQMERFQMERFRELAPLAENNPTPIHGQQLGIM